MKYDMIYDTAIIINKRDIKKWQQATRMASGGF
jgi:hypothetical protein